jgi:hypothetical protein
MKANDSYLAIRLQYLLVFHHSPEVTPQESAGTCAKLPLKEICMKRITAIALFVAATFMTAGSLMAEPSSGKVNVPFNFTVNNITLPAGTYSIASDLVHPNQLIIRDQANCVKAIEVGMYTTVAPGKTGSLIFHQYGDQYFLSEIHFSSASSGFFLPATSLERRVRKLSHKEIITPVGLS